MSFKTLIRIRWFWYTLSFFTLRQQNKRMHYLIIGGGGFLGQSICDLLLEKGAKNKVSIFDLREPKQVAKGVFQVITGDITQYDSVAKALKGVDVVIHTASPIHGLSAEIYHKVNVEGTLNIIKACIQERVKKLVYTSSAGVVYNGQDLFCVDESEPYCEVHMDAYNETKAMAEELVLEANGKGSLLTCAIRPSGIFGPRYILLFCLMFCMSCIYQIDH